MEPSTNWGHLFITIKKIKNPFTTGYTTETKQNKVRNLAHNITYFSNCSVLCSYTDRHQIQLFGRGHIGGIDIKVNNLLYLHLEIQRAE